MTNKQLIESMLEIEFLLNSLSGIADEIDSLADITDETESADVGGKDEKDD